MQISTVAMNKKGDRNYQTELSNGNVFEDLNQPIAGFRITRSNHVISNNSYLKFLIFYEDLDSYPGSSFNIVISAMNN
ncbi:hypothetical protein [Egbenema bharatensis]|uniref:hypothetical protein n=1 Tax=Egbenema bharatensis TaxID=3463334 RepID=UPI003A87F1D5